MNTKPKIYILAKPDKYMSQMHIDFNLGAALEDGWLIEKPKNNKSDES